MNKPYLQAAEYTISFFRFLIYIYFNKDFVKSFWKNYHFLIQISKNHFKTWYITYYYDVISCNTKMVALGIQGKI